ncbi:hypothetical protein B296_00007100 [Ensete ventricosum]|uniref:Uncharacterized protein n=1 Tax=Ensete ventricosum TaxID=4639 RepID=A0A427AQZ5_ENSVE|nr:hypothetical protein B296_00007100 [Ensete ventricosum]
MSISPKWLRVLAVLHIAQLGPLRLYDAIILLHFFGRICLQQHRVCVQISTIDDAANGPSRCWVGRA